MQTITKVVAVGLVAAGAVAAFSVLDDIDQAEEDTEVRQGQNEALPGEIDDGPPLGPTPASGTGGLAGFWSGGTCRITGYNGQPYAGTTTEPQMFPLIISLRADGQLQVDAHPMDQQLNRTLTYRIEGNHVHAEETSDAGVRGNIRDFTLQGDKLVGTYTRFDKYHQTDTTYTCETQKM